jgi:protoporphyrinogen oxidase
MAYPVYDAGYREHVATIRRYLEPIENLQTIGRNGMHRYNNQDHAMLTGLLASRNLQGEAHDLWTVNTDRSYYEDFTTEQYRSAKNAG